MEREAFTFYKSFYKSASKIKDPIQRLAFYEAVAKYGITHEETDLTEYDVADVAFESSRPNLDSGWVKSEAGSKGGRSKNDSACADKKSRIESASNSEKAESNLLSEKSKHQDQEYNQDQEQEILTDTNVSVRQTEAVRHVVSEWNKLADVGISTISRISSDSKRFKSLRARLNEYGEEKVIEAIHRIRDSDFLTGRNKKGWTITFDWFVLPSNFPKVLEGNYDKRDGISGNSIADLISEYEEGNRDNDRE